MIPTSGDSASMSSICSSVSGIVDPVGRGCSEVPLVWVGCGSENSLISFLFSGLG